jgi:hypothetical protein
MDTDASMNALNAWTTCIWLRYVTLTEVAAQALGVRVAAKGV